jgi:hypothetical protein
MHHMVDGDVYDLQAYESPVAMYPSLDQFGAWITVHGAGCLAQVSSVNKDTRGGRCRVESWARTSCQ